MAGIVRAEKKITIVEVHKSVSALEGSKCDMETWVKFFCHNATGTIIQKKMRKKKEQTHYQLGYTETPGNCLYTKSVLSDNGKNSFKIIQI